MTTSSLPLPPPALPLLASVVLNDENIGNYLNNNQVNIVDKNENDNDVNKSVNEGKNIHEEKGTIITDKMTSNNVYSSTSTSTSLQVAKTSILYLLQNMVKMGATEFLIGEKAVKKIAETVDLIVHSTDSTLLKSSNKFLYQEKLLILVNTVLAQNDDKKGILVAAKDIEISTIASARSLIGEPQSQGGHLSFLVIGDENVNVEENVIKDGDNNCKLQDEIIRINKFDIKMENGNEISCDESWAEAVHDLLLQLLNN